MRRSPLRASDRAHVDWYLGLALRNLFPSIGTAVKAMDKKKLYQVGGGGGSGSSAWHWDPVFRMRVSFNRALSNNLCPSSSLYVNRFSLFPPFPSLSIQCTPTRCMRALLLHGGFVRVKNDWFCLIRGRERGTCDRASANCEMQEFKEARPR